MKFFSTACAAFGILLFTSCGSGSAGDNTERTLLDSDTVAAEKEYEVEKTYREVTVDTVTETETVTKEVEP